MSVNTKMTAIADEIRELSGTTEPMSLDVMASNLGDANTEVAGQSEILEQIIAALVNRAGYNTVYIGSDDPAADLGINGDIYIKRSETI